MFALKQCEVVLAIRTLSILVGNRLITITEKYMRGF